MGLIHILITACFTLCPFASWADCIDQSSSWTCNTWIDLKSCVEGEHSTCDSFQDGDTINIAPGLYSTTSEILITDPITINGGGAFAVIDGDPPTENGTWPVILNGNGGRAFVIQGSSGDEIVITGIKFTGSWDNNHYVGGSVHVSNSNKTSKWIIHDNCINASGRFIAAACARRGGLIYKNYIQDSGTGTLGIAVKEITELNPKSGGYCAQKMMDAPNWGGSDFTFIEDNVWKSSTVQTGSSAIDFSYAAKVVIRYNYFYNNFISIHNITHDYVRGCIGAEAYKNTWKDSDPSPDSGISSAYGIRSGTHLFHNNTVDGLQFPATIYQERKGAANTWLNCNPANPWDGTTWCLDQPGRAESQGSNFSFNPASSDIQEQVLWPIYLWDLNLVNNTGSLTVTHPNMTENVDYYFCDSNCTEGTDYPPGYTTYTYPHPWRVSDNTAPAAPTGLTVQPL